MAENQKLMEEVMVLEERLQAVRRAIEAGGEKPPASRELLREVVRGRMHEAERLEPMAPPPAGFGQQIAGKPLPHDETDDEEEVKQYVAIAFEKDIPAAVRMVRETGNAHLLDALHDILVDQFFDALAKRGKIKL